MVIIPNFCLPPGHLNHTGNLSLKIIRLLENLRNMLLLQSLIVSIALRDRYSREQHVADLTPIELLERRIFLPLV